MRALSSRNIEDSIESLGLHVYTSCGTTIHDFTLYPSENEESGGEESDDEESEGDNSSDGEEVCLI